MTEGATLYSCVDLHSAFYACAVKKEHQKYLAFSTHRGMFTYSRMAQGFLNSPSWLASGLTQLLMTPYTGPGPPEVRNKPCLGNICTCFVDDVCIFSKEDKWHHHYLDFIFGLFPCGLRDLGVSVYLFSSAALAFRSWIILCSCAAESRQFCID